MKVEKKRIGEKDGYFIICSDEEFESLKPFLLKYNPQFLDGKVEEISEGLQCPKLDCDGIMEGDRDGYWCPKCEDYYPPDIIEEWIKENE